MKKNVMLEIMLTLMLIGTLTFAFNIQPVRASGTIYIKADGSIDPPDAPISTFDNATYTFTEDITYTGYDTAIVIGRDDIILDGNGYVLQGLGVGGHGIDLYYGSNVTIRNMKVEKFNYGIYLSGSSNNSIVECNITQNVNGAGISIYESPNNRIVRCNLTSNGYNVLLSSSSNNMLKNNSMTNKRYYNIAVWGDELSHFAHDVDESNTVNGKPICYWINRQGMEVPPDVGYVALINSTNITVEELELKNNAQGILLAYTTNSRISNNNLIDNKYGICFFSSSLNIVSGNNISGNGDNGIYLGNSSNNVFYSNKITYSGGGLGISTGDGIRLKSSHNNTFFGNTIESNQGSGISLEESSKNNNIYGNKIGSNGWSGISLVTSSNNNTVFENQITNNSVRGINIYGSCNNTFYNNNFINNTDHVVIHTPGYANFWDDGYSSGGNYWSDYNGTDLSSGFYQNDTGSDGIGDMPHTIDANNVDNYPLMGMFSDFNATSECRVQTICNSSISSFQYNGTSIRFNVTGEDGTAGFCRICVPTALMNENYKVFVNGTEIPHTLLPGSNSTYSYLYFTYNHSTQEVIIIPELPSTILLPFLMISTLVAFVLKKKRRIKQQKRGG